jgi:hypothetical protein
MKKVLPIIIIGLLLASCTGAGNNQTISDAELQTRVAQILTVAPTQAVRLPTIAPTSAINPLNPTDTELAATTAPTEAEEATETPNPPSETEAVETEAPTAEVTSNATATKTSLPTATFPPGDPRAKLGAPAWVDKMDNATYWPTGATEFTDIYFQNGHMALVGLTPQYGWRLASTASLTNFYLEMSASTQTCAGADSYGLMFRVPDASAADQGYFFGITCDGKYTLRRWNGKIEGLGKMTYLITDKASSIINVGSNQANRLGVKVVANHITLYINGKYVSDQLDNIYKAGNFGVFVKATNTQNLTILVDEMSYWLNPPDN